MMMMMVSCDNSFVKMMQNMNWTEKKTQTFAKLIKTIAKRIGQLETLSYPLYQFHSVSASWNSTKDSKQSIDLMSQFNFTCRHQTYITQLQSSLTIQSNPITACFQQSHSNTKTVEDINRQLHSAIENDARNQTDLSTS